MFDIENHEKDILAVGYENNNKKHTTNRIN